MFKVRKINGEYNIIEISKNIDITLIKPAF